MAEPPSTSGSPHDPLLGRSQRRSGGCLFWGGERLMLSVDLLTHLQERQFEHDGDPGDGDAVAPKV